MNERDTMAWQRWFAQLVCFGLVVWLGLLASAADATSLCRWLDDKGQTHLSAVCFGPYRTTRGATKPEGFAHCNVISSPEIACGLRSR
jgi:hypothetical protein